MNNILSYLISNYIRPLYCVSKSIHEASTVAKKYHGEFPNYKTYRLLEKLNKQLELKYTPQKLYNLTTLNLEYHNLDYLPENIALLINLRELNLSFQRLYYLPESIGQLQNLQYLNLCDNKLYYLPESIGQLQNLRRLILYDNNLKNLPESIGLLQNLREIHINNSDSHIINETIKQNDKIYIAKYEY